MHGTGLPVAVGAEMFAATMNCNMGGRDHGAVEVERAVIEWLVHTAGFPADTGFGVLTGGTSQATLLSMHAARVRLFGADLRKRGIKGLPSVRVYAAEGAHTCIKKALEILGYGSDSLRSVSVDEVSGKMDMTALAAMVEEDASNDLVPLAVVGTAGSVNLGIYDNLREIGEFCSSKNLWFHVDAAFGFWVRLAAEPFCSLIDGLHMAHSIGLDFHKWSSVPYQCGACVVRNGQDLKNAFSMRPPYLAGHAGGLAGGDLWFCDYGIDLSRGFSALKVWTALKSFGTKSLGEAITDNCLQAQYMGMLVEKSPLLVLCNPVVSNICCFAMNDNLRAKKSVAAAAGVDIIEEVVTVLQVKGDAVLSTTILPGYGKVFRAAIVNHRTTKQDIEIAISAVEAALL